MLKVATISLKPQIFITEYLERKISHANHHAPNTIIPYALMYCANHTIVTNYNRIQCFYNSSSVIGLNTAITLSKIIQRNF